MVRELLPRSNLGLRFLSLLIALVLFLVVRGERHVSQRYEVPLRVRLPVGVAPSGSMPNHLRVSLTGPWARLRSLRGKDIGPVTLDLSATGPGTATWFVRADALRLPSGVHVESIYPSQGEVELVRR